MYCSLSSIKPTLRSQYRKDHHCSKPRVSKLWPAGRIRPTIQLLLACIKFRKNSCISYIFLYNVNFLQTLKKCLIMINPKHGIISTIDGNAIDIIYVDELEIQCSRTTVLLIVCSPARCLVFYILPLLQNFGRSCSKP